MALKMRKIKYPILRFTGSWTTKSKKSKKKKKHKFSKHAGIWSRGGNFYAVPAEELTTTYEADQNDTTGKVKTTQKLVPVTVSIVISDALRMNVRTEIADWKKLVGKTGILRVGKNKFGVGKMSLLSVEVADVILDDFGRMRKVKLNLSFIERNNKKSKAMKAAAADKSSKKRKNKNSKKSKSKKKKKVKSK